VSSLGFPFDPFFHPLKQPDYYEALYFLSLTPSWSIYLPNSTETGTRNLFSIQQTWSWAKTQLKPLEILNPPLHDSSDLFKCNKVLNCCAGPEDTPETWFLKGVRGLVRDICTCWGYPSRGFGNKDPLCDKTYNDNTAKYCGVPYTYYAIKSPSLPM